MMAQGVSSPPQIMSCSSSTAMTTKASGLERQSATDLEAAFMKASFLSPIAMLVWTTTEGSPGSLDMSPRLGLGHIAARGVTTRDVDRTGRTNARRALVIFLSGFAARRAKRAGVSAAGQSEAIIVNRALCGDRSSVNLGSSVRCEGERDSLGAGPNWRMNAKSSPNKNPMKGFAVQRTLRHRTVVQSSRCPRG